MGEPDYVEKIVGYVDILGFKSLVRAAEEGHGLSTRELSEVVKSLGAEDDCKRLKKYGPTWCPKAPRISRDLDFQITRASDCVFISAEISPAGVINLIAHCWSACMNLMTKGIMCRGYIKRGRIYHTLEAQFGTGLSDAVERERLVSIFKRDANERGTPFIEIDKDVVAYIENQADQCVKEIFSRCTKSDGTIAAVFPFKRLNHRFMIGGSAGSFDPNREITSLNNMRKLIRKMQEQIRRHINPLDQRAVEKAEHYIQMLDVQLGACDRTEEMINWLDQPYPSRGPRSLS